MDLKDGIKITEMTVEDQKKDRNTQITNIELNMMVAAYNKNHGLKFSLRITAMGYNVLTIGNGYYGPMSNLEAYFFIKGFREAREFVSNA